VTEPQPPPPDRISGWIGHIKGLSLTNVLVIITLALVAIPAYLAWRILNDPQLSGFIFSTYEERALAGTDCRVRITSMSGAGPVFNITRPFAYSGEDRWYLGISMPVEPNEVDAGNYCAALGSLIEYARDRSKPSPVFPNTDLTIFPPTIQVR
jgi:hypothetical protein